MEILVGVFVVLFVLAVLYWAARKLSRIGELASEAPNKVSEMNFNGELPERGLK